MVPDGLADEFSLKHCNKIVEMIRITQLDVLKILQLKLDVAD